MKREKSCSRGKPRTLGLETGMKNKVTFIILSSAVRIFSVLLCLGPALRSDGISSAGRHCRFGVVRVLPSLVQSQSKSVAWVVQVGPFIIGNLGSSVTQLPREMGLPPARLALHTHPCGTSCLQVPRAARAQHRPSAAAARLLQLRSETPVGKVFCFQVLISMG